ncbi:hypothetical protein [Streptomyces celluloflavus]|uniref:hypothetical protein n=1 Tax=Streptomyces celluloflavus TaxID=58344 RepID=UPI00369892F7
MTTTEEYGQRCSELFAAGGYAAARRTAQEGIRQDGAAADLYCWLALAHVREDDDDHDDEAERAFRRGLEIAPDHLGLLAGYAELCLRADAFDQPGRAARGKVLLRRIEEVTPGSSEAERAAAVQRWTQRPYPYREDFRTKLADARAQRDAADAQRADASYTLEHAGAEDAPRQAGARAQDRPDDHRAAVLAATLAALSGPRNAPLRLLVRYRAQAWTLAALLSICTNTLLRATGVVESFSLWGLLWLLPALILDRRLAAARRQAERQVVAQLEARPLAADPR